MTQVPTALKVTTPAEIEQILDDAGAIVIVTDSDDVAVAVGV